MGESLSTWSVARYTVYLTCGERVYLECGESPCERVYLTRGERVYLEGGVEDSVGRGDPELHLVLPALPGHVNARGEPSRIEGGRVIVSIPGSGTMARVLHTREGVRGRGCRGHKDR